MIKEVNIKTKLFYFWDDDYDKFKELACNAMRDYFKGKEHKSNLPDLLFYILKNREHKPIKMNNFKEGKHKKTTLLYFSEQEHIFFTYYMEKVVFKFLPEGGCKKQAQTNAIFNLLNEYLG